MDPLIISSISHRDRCFLFSWHKLCGSLAHLASVCCYNGSFPSDVMLQFLTASTGRQYYHLAFLKDTFLILQKFANSPWNYWIMLRCTINPDIQGVCKVGKLVPVTELVKYHSDDQWQSRHMSKSLKACFHISLQGWARMRETCLLRESRVPMHSVWLQLHQGPRVMMLYSHAGHQGGPDKGDVTTPLHTQKAPGFLQGEEDPQHEFHQQNWSSLQLADIKRSWLGRFLFQVHTWPITCEGKMAIDVTLEHFYKWSLLSISFSRQRGMSGFDSSSFCMTHFHAITPIRSCLSRVFSSSG